MGDDDFPDALPARYRLHWYVLERVLGQGGFGITYLAHDSNLDRHVAIKEYLPSEVARRRSDATAHPRADTLADRYSWGLERFLSEARTLARFDHPNIVRVLSVFEANNTAYMVMRFEEGEDLATLLDRRGTIPQEQLTACLFPVLDGLQLIHRSGFIHRDIKPENIYVRHDGSPVLLDFGSARQSFGNPQTMTILVAPGYAPLEQYYGDAKSQGPWTDIYGLGATCYRAIAGRPPLDAIARAKGVLGSTRDILQQAVDVGRGRYDERMLLAIDHALQLSEGNRPQSISEWQLEIMGRQLTQTPTIATPVTPARPDISPPVTPLLPVDQATRPAATSESLTGGRSATRTRTIWYVAVVALGIIATVGIIRQWPTAGRAAPIVASRPNLPEQSLTPRPALPASHTPTTVTVAAPPLGSPAVAGREPVTKPTGPAVGNLPLQTRSVGAGVESATAVSTAKASTLVGRAGPGGTPRALTVAPLKAAPAALEMSSLTLQSPVTVPAALTKSAPAISPGAASDPMASLSPPGRTRDDQLEAGEAALQRGDSVAATNILTPLAAAGVVRAQSMLGRAQEARPQGQRSDFEAYVWYSIAARSGDAGAAASRDKLAATLQPAEIRQAEQIAQHWKPRTAPTAASNPERTTP